MIIAQASQIDFWTFPPETAIGWLGAISVFVISVAGGVKAVRYLAASAIAANRWGFTRYRERRRVESRLDELTSNEGWPNGSHSLKESHSALYQLATNTATEVAKTSEKVDRVELAVAELTRTVETAIISSRTG